MRRNPMLRGLAALACAALFATTALAAPTPQVKPDAIGYAPLPFQRLGTGGSPNDVLSGTVLYDNVGSPSTRYYEDQFGEEAIDDVHLVSGGSLDLVSFEYFEPADGASFSATVRIYDNPGGLDLGSTPLAGPYTVTGLASGRHIVSVSLDDAPVVGADLWVGVRFSSETAGLVISEVPSVGISHDRYLENGTLLYFNGNPIANFALRLVDLPSYELNVSTVGMGTVSSSLDQPLYVEGTTVHLTATPEVGWHFVAWSGAASGSENPIEVAMDADKSILATFEINTYALNVATIGLGTVSKSPEQLLYDHGTVVQLMAAPEVGWHFAGWSGAASGSANPLEVTMDAAKSVTATFEINTYALGLAAVGQGLVAKSPEQAAYDHGMEVDVYAEPEFGWRFVEWSGAASGSGNPTSVTMDAAKSVTATFEINTYALSVATLGQGGVAKSPEQVGYDHGTVVQLTATPEIGWHFVGWSGNATGAANPIDVTMYGDLSVSATFAINTYALSVTASGQGTVAKKPDQGVYDHGTVVQLTATPEAGWHFVGWSGATTGSMNPRGVRMDAAKSVTATFEINTYALSVSTTGLGTVAKSPSLAAYDHGTVVQLTANPQVGWHFVSWSGAASGTANPTTVTMDAAKSVTATFEINTYALSVATVGQGTVSKSPNQALYDHGTEVQLSASPQAGWHFAGWSGSASGTANPLAVTMDAAKSVTATFAINTYAIQVTTLGEGTVSKSPNQAAYDHGTTVQLTATPAPGWVFKGWSGDASGSEPTASVLVESEKSVTATFALVITFEFKPHKLNLKAKDKLVTGYLKVPEAYDARQIDIESILLNGVVPVSDRYDAKIDKHDTRLKVKFSRLALLPTLEPGDEEPLTVTGTIGALAFTGVDLIKVKAPKVKKPKEDDLLVPGTSVVVEWNAHTDPDEPSRITLMASFDGGQTWRIEKDKIDNTGRYEWMVPNVSTRGAMLNLLTIFDTDETGVIPELEIAMSDSFAIVGALSAEVGRPGLALKPANPVVGPLSVNFSLVSDAAATLSVYDISGRRVASREVGASGPGWHTTQFRGLPAGLFIVQLSQAGRRLTSRVAILR